MSSTGSSKSKSRAVALAAVAFVVAAASVAVAVGRKSAVMKREILRYDRLCEQRDWRKIIELSDAREPLSLAAYGYRNLALANEGKLLDGLFRWPDMEPSGLVPESRSTEYSNYVEMEIFYWMGLVNISRRYAFEAQEAAPDHKARPRLYRRLAETNILLGYDEVAAKYLHVLRRCLARCYREWDAYGNPEYPLIRSRQPRSFDIFFSEVRLQEIERALLRDNPDNAVAAQYLLASLLLEKDLEGFCDIVEGMKFPSPAPRYVQEAVAVLHHDSPLVSDLTRRRLADFRRSASAAQSTEEMIRTYPDTYWLYYFYRNLNPPSSDEAPAHQ